MRIFPVVNNTLRKKEVRKLFLLEDSAITERNYFTKAARENLNLKLFKRT